MGGRRRTRAIASERANHAASGSRPGVALTPIGQLAGENQTQGSDNLYLANQGVAGST